MKQIFLLCLTLFFTIQIQGGSPSKILLHTQKKGQVIDGFGIAQAGWADELYLHHRRAEVMDKLFGDKGLRLSIMRGEVFPQWPTDSTDDHVKRCAQLWLTRYAKEVCKVDKLIFSTWSPPAYMKSNAKVSHGYLKQEYYHAFADYLVAFCKAYEEAGLKLYAISPSNEPGYEAPWNSCKWTPQQMGTFLTEYLEPAIKKSCPDVRIIYGENPSWSNPEHPKLQFLSSQKFVEEILAAHPAMDGNTYIASGHGYEIPLSQYIPGEKDVEVPIIPYQKAMEKGQHVWVTEVSSVDPLDAGMENGLKWAALFHRYLTDAQVNAFVWWGGAMPTSNNESLIVLDKDRENYTLTKRYATFGNYTRYIPVGSQRVENELISLPKEVMVSSFCQGKQYTTVVVNPTDKEIRCRLQTGDAEQTGALMQYTTTASQDWEQTEIKHKGKGYSLLIPPHCVASLVGLIK